MDEKKSLKTLFDFYFASKWYVFFSISYLLFFLYSAIFFFDNIILAIKFIFYTLGLSTSLLGLNYLFLSVAFIITLIIPFLISLYAIIMLQDLWENQSLQTKQKFVLTMFLIVINITIIISMDDIIRFVAKQEPLNDFVQRNQLNYRLLNSL